MINKKKKKIIVVSQYQNDITFKNNRLVIKP